MIDKANQFLIFFVSSHCDACQKVSGSDYTQNQIVPQENFEHIKGSLTRYTYKGDSGMDALLKLLLKRQ